MMPTGSIDATRRDAGYEFVTAQDVPVWPGSMTRHVFRHVATGELWASDACSDEDSSWETGGWYPVEARQVTAYEPIPLPPWQGPRYQGPIFPSCPADGRSILDVARGAHAAKPEPTAPIPDYGQHMDWEEFAGCVACGALTDDDGHGVLATATAASDFPIDPSRAGMMRPAWATHVVWFTKYTPTGRLDVVIDNPTVTDALKVGDLVYVDITKI